MYQTDTDALRGVPSFFGAQEFHIDEIRSDGKRSANDGNVTLTSHSVMLLLRRLWVGHAPFLLVVLITNIYGKMLYTVIIRFLRKETGCRPLDWT